MSIGWPPKSLTVIAGGFLATMCLARPSYASSFGYEYLLSASATTAPVEELLFLTGNGPKGQIPASTLAASINDSVFAGALGIGTADATGTARGSNGSIGTFLRGDGNNGSSSVHSTINYWEQLTITSDTEPTGSAGTFDFLGHLTFTGPCAAQGSLTISLYLDGTLHSGTPCHDFQFQFDGVVGQVITVYWQLQGDLTVGSGGAYDTNINALNTLTPFIDPISPDFGYTTASGRSYLGAPAAVPEPATFLLVSSVLLPLVRRRARR